MELQLITFTYNVSDEFHSRIASPLSPWLISSLEQIKKDMSPNVGTQASTDQERLDLAADINLQASLAALHLPSLSEGIVVALTGASGFLGRKILQNLVDIPEIKTVHCLAVRNPSILGGILSSSKVVPHAGDLSHLNLGLTSDTIREVFCFADVVIHNGAEVSFSKSYDALRGTNVGSTREIARLSLEYNHVKHIQFVSTSGLATLLSRDLYESPTTGSVSNVPAVQGYFLTKLACERYLENVSMETGLPVTIYRPTIIIGPDAPRLDVMHSVLHFSEKISAVPQLTGIEGTLQFVDVDRVAQDILLGVLRGSARRSHVQFRSQYDDNVEIHGLDTFVRKRSGTDVSTMPVKDWVLKAKKSGLSPEVARFLEAVQLRESERGGRLALRRLWKGPAQQ